tara:strand:- start:251 stop:379 length:129 start_codon:yes stop_codon:yes gene_type:complete
MPPKQNKPFVWKRGVDYIIYNPPRKSKQTEEWNKIKDKEDDK